MVLDIEAVMTKARHGVLVLRPSRLKMLLLLLFSAGFVALGVAILFHEEGQVVVGSLTIVFFGICTVVFVARLLPGRAYLRLDATGFTVRNAWRGFSVRWADVWAFQVAIAGQRAVGWNHIPEAAPSGVVADLSRALNGVEGVLPDSYGLRVEDLVLLMESWRAVCTTSGVPAPDDEGQPEPE